MVDSVPIPTPDVIDQADREALSPEERRRLDAVIARSRFDAQTRGALARADMLDRQDIARLAFGVTELMLIDLITGRVKPRNAKEAADVGKIAQAIGRTELGIHADAIDIRTPQDRENAIEAIKQLTGVIASRREQAALEAGPPVNPEPPADNASEADPDLAAASIARRSEIERREPVSFRAMRAAATQEA